MAEQVDGIEIIIDVDTRDVMNANKRVGMAVSGIEKNAKRLDTSMTKSTKSVRRGLSGMGRNAGQAGIQIQQLVGQVTAGSNPLVAFSQQSADLGFVLGVPLAGAVVSIAAALGTVFLPALFDSTSATEALEESIKQIEETAKLSDNGIAELSDEIVRLARVSQGAAEARLVVAMQEADEAAREASDGITDLLGNVSLLEQGFTGRVQNAFRELGEGLGLTGREAQNAGFQIGRVVQQLQRDPSTENYTKLLDVFGGLVKEAGDNLSPAIAELFTEVEGLASGAIQAGEISAELEAKLKDLTGTINEQSEGTKNAKSALDELIESTRIQSETVGKSARELAVYTAQQLGATEEQIKSINALYDSIEAKEQDIDATKKQTAEQERALTVYESLRDRLSQSVAELKDSDAAFEQNIQRQREAAEAAGGNADEIERLLRLERELKQQRESDESFERVKEQLALQQARVQLSNDELEIQQALNALGGDSTQDQRDQITALIEQTQALRDQAALLGPELQDAFGNVGLSALDSFSSGLANIITEGASAQEVFSNLAGTIANELLSAFIRYAVGQAAAAIAGQAATTSAGVAQAGTLATAYAPAAALASLATGGANAIPASAGIGSTVGLAKTLALGGGRLYGGGVEPGTLYPVTEDGRPEVLTQGNKSYLLPGSRGNVTSNRDMGGMGSPAPIVNINNYGSEQATATTRTEGSGANAQQIVDVVIGNLRGRRGIHKAITDTTTANNKTRGG